MIKTHTPIQKILDEAGRQKTLSHGAYAFIFLDFQNFNSLYSTPSNKTLYYKSDILFLGTGAFLDDILKLSAEKNTVYYLEHPAFSKQIPIQLPKNFQKVTPTDLPKLISAEFFEKTDIVFYKQNLQLFPSFWNTILISLRSLYNTLFQPYVSPKKGQYIFLSGTKNDLLHAELIQAIEILGYIPFEIGNKNLQEILELLDNKTASLYLSINAQTLDPNGIIYEYLKQKHIPLALWFVDNPWNILSDFPQKWWQDCPLFLTDFSFFKELKNAGAKQVYPLPLAAHSLPTHYFDLPQIPLFFVGNSAFINKSSYFSACRLDYHFEQNIYRTIKSNLEQQKKLPDFHDFYTELCGNEILWQNKKQRLISYATTKADLYLRKLWLEHLHPLIHIMGDNAWQDILSTPFTYLPAVNYYTQLPSYYKQSLFTLNLTSLLMPENLSQRHFDVWAHDGFLLSSLSKGMEIFPSDLTNLISVQNPANCLDKIEMLLTKPHIKIEIQKTMQEEIREKHNYTDRLQKILNIC